MLAKLKSFFLTKDFVIIAFIFVIFLLLRLPGIHLPYHQDEMKTALISNAGAVASSEFLHPPLTQFIYRIENLLFGPDYFRVFILIFAILGLVMAFVLARRRLGRESGLYTLFFLTIGAYSVHSSLMLDTDGAILPLFFLISVYFYDRMLMGEGKWKKIFLGLTLLSLVFGFLIKLSFIIVIGAIICDFLYRERARMNRKFITMSALSVLAIPLIFVLTILIVKFFYPVFSISGMISHASSYINFGQRGWMQIIIQAIKAIFYLSPALIFLPILVTKEIFEKTRVFFIYLFLGFIFYFVLFDFSEGALDKYLMFTIVPLSIIAGGIVADALKEKGNIKRYLGIAIGVVGSIFIGVLTFLPYDVLPLYPKSLWATSVFNLKWNILFPLTGGSGPLGFYMPFLFISFSFILIGILCFFARLKSKWRQILVIAILVITFTYNIVFVEEFLFGKLYGSAPKVLSESIEFIKDSEDINKVISYSDAGTYELKKINKYSGRFYAVPGNEEGHKKKFADFDGHYLVIDIPKINDDSFYRQFFSKCTSVFEAKSGVITSNIYKCYLND